MKALIIHNPAAGSRAYAEELSQTTEYLIGQGWEIPGVETTNGPGDATTYARRAVAQGCDAVFLIGGDGTIAQTVDGLVGSETMLAVLPGGTGNIFARQLNLPVPGGLHPRPIMESARLLLDGQVRRVDVGRVTPLGRGAGREAARHFLCWVGVGFDAQVNRNVEADPALKRRLGTAATVITSFLTLREFAGTSARVRVDGHRVSRRMVMLVASNIQLYGLLFRMAENAVMDDGLLDVFCFQGHGPARILLHAARLLVNRHIADPEVDNFRARRVEITTSQALPVHVDGDYVGNTPIVMEVRPRALNLLVPSCAPASLFTDGTGMLPKETPWDWVQRMARDVQSALKERSSMP